MSSVFWACFSSLALELEADWNLQRGQVMDGGGLFVIESHSDYSLSNLNKQAVPEQDFSRDFVAARGNDN